MNRIDKLRDELAAEFVLSSRCEILDTESAHMDSYKFGYSAASDLWSKECEKLESALRGIIEIGKRDMSNPKYDSYFEGAKEVLAQYNEFIGGKGE